MSEAKKNKKKRDPLLGVVLDGKYRLKERIGEGGRARVYRGEPVAGGPDVAVKVQASVRGDSKERAAHRLKRFQREALAMLQLQHINTVAEIDFGITEDDRPYLVLELLEGQSLGELIRATGGPLPPREVARIARRVCLSLAEAHEHGIVHRDIKPDNIMLVDEPEGRVVKVVDFGAARLDRAVHDQMTGAGDAVGSAPYMSPEQARGEELTPASDLYSLGITVYEALTGELPFRGDFSDLLAAHCFQAPPRLLHPELEGERLARWQALLDSLLAKEPGDRPQYAERVAATLSPLRQRPERPARRWPWLILAAAVLAAVAVGAVLLAGG